MSDHVLALLGRPDTIPLTVPEIAKKLRLPRSQATLLEEAVTELETLGRIARVKGERYIVSLDADLIPGRIQITRSGRGFLTPDDPGLKEIAIPESGTGTAFHEDRVLVRRDVRPKGLLPSAPPPTTGSVVRILERRRKQFVGTLQRSRQFLYVVPDDPRIPHDIYVPEPRDVGRPARVGDKVVVELHEWLSRHTNPEGEVIEVLGSPDAEGVDILSILRHHGLSLQFPKEVLAQARSLPGEPVPSDFVGRIDCRSHTVITIDPDDARDFDDAICLAPAEKKQWRLWVHIADVSHYVRPGTVLDEEARRRGNSTYLVDRVIPMLPEAISNGLCSLKPDVDRLTKCVEFLLSEEGQVLKTRFYPAVIHSKRRFTYQEALAILQRKPADPIEEVLHQAHDLAQKIRRHRFDQGALELDFPESKIRLDDQGRVTHVELMENDVSHQLIEEFMLLANEAVAARLTRLGRPCVHRVHESPESTRLEEYRQEVLSHNVACGNLAERKEIQKLLRHLNTLNVGSALKIGFLKSLPRARYSTQALGHYGLAKRHYTHFTSPIRRYADLLVHRALFEPTSKPSGPLQVIADHISSTERNSADAERASKDVKLFAFLEAQLQSGKPSPHAALVTEVRNFGLFVDVPSLAMKGMIPLSSLEDDFYAFDARRIQLVGRRTGRVIRLGESLDVEVHRINRFKKQVDFRFARTGTRKGGRKPSPGAQRPQGKSSPATGRKTGPAPQRARDSGPARPAKASTRTPTSKGSRPSAAAPVRSAGKPVASRRPSSAPTSRQSPSTRAAGTTPSRARGPKDAAASSTAGTPRLKTASSQRTPLTVSTRSPRGKASEPGSRNRPRARGSAGAR